MRTSFSTLARFAVVGSIVTAAVVACGGATTGNLGGSGGGGSVNGTVSGTSFAVASQIAAIQAASTSCSSGGSGGSSSSSGGSTGGSTSGGGTGQTCTSTGQAVIVLLTNRADANCAAAQASISSQNGVEFSNLDDLELIVENALGDVTAGTYSIVVPNSNATSGAAAQFATTNATCSPVANTQAVSGSVTLTGLSATEVSGSYSVSFGSEGSFSGTFDVAVCDLPDAGTSIGGAPPTCQ